MKKKILIAMVLALMAVLMVVSPIMADDASVTVSDVNLQNVGSLGETVTASGSVTISATATSDVHNWQDFAQVSGGGTVTVTNPDGTIIYNGTLSGLSQSDHDNPYSFPWWTRDDSGAYVNILVTIPWSVDIGLSMVGIYTVDNYGYALAESWAQAGWWVINHDKLSASDSKKARIYTNPNPEPVPAWSGLGGITVYVNDKFTKFQSASYTAPTSRIMASGIDLSTDGLRVIIPTGTIINKDATLASSFGMEYKRGILSFITQNMTFSNPVTILATDGTVIAYFDKIVNGVANEVSFDTLLEPILHQPLP